jgi:alcohol dehydrogenase class IV
MKMEESQKNRICAIESYVSFNGTPFSDLLTLEAIRLISKNLPAQ